VDAADPRTLRGWAELCYPTTADRQRV